MGTYGEDGDIVFSLNKSFQFPERVGPYVAFRLVPDDPNKLMALGFACEEQVCDLADVSAPCFVNEADCRAWGDYQSSLGAGGGGGDGGGGGGGGGSSKSSGGAVDPCKSCPCPAPYNLNYCGCCCGENQFPGGARIDDKLGILYDCLCVPGSVFGPTPGTCVNPWRPGGYDGVGGS